jgi:hypothetical protein
MEAQVFDDKKPDMACVPYRRKTLYSVLTVLFLLVLIWTAVYLWAFSPWLTASLVLCYIGLCFLQAYCCAYQKCPYVGRFCPAVAGIMPASWLAKLIYGRREVVKSKARFETFVMIGYSALIGMAILPLWWIAKLSVPLAMGYFVWQLVYYLVFQLMICPACAIRETCPGGKLQSIVFRKRCQ